VAKHPFRVAIEANANDGDLCKLFAPDVVIKAPMLTKPVKGAKDVLNIIGHAVRLAGPITYTLEVRDSKQTILLWEGKAGGFTLQAATILVDGDDGADPRGPGSDAPLAGFHDLSQRHIQRVIRFDSCGLLGTTTEGGR
jgi:hypothetical protein